MWRALLPLCGFLLAGPASACETALLLAVDVSGSISNEEYSLQMEGLADALGDPDVIAALVGGQDKVALVHWSGLHKQRLSLPWVHLQSATAVFDLAQSIRRIRRPQDHTDTAIGAALYFSLDLFAEVQDCQRHVIDISGDGAENAGTSLPAARAEVEANGITLNAIAIEETPDDLRLTGYFRRFVISSDGFVVTSHGLQDYPRAIHQKLLRELTKAVS